MGMEVTLVAFPSEVPRPPRTRGIRNKVHLQVLSTQSGDFCQREAQLEMSMSSPLHTHTHTHTQSLERSLCFLVAGSHRGSESLLRWFIIILQDLPGDFQAAASAVHIPLHSLPALTQPSPSAPNAPVPGERGFLSVSVTAHSNSDRGARPLPCSLASPRPSLCHLAKAYRYLLTREHSFCSYTPRSNKPDG